MPAFRHTSIDNWKRYKLDSVRAAKIRFSLQAKLANLRLIEKAYDQINTAGFPTRKFGFQPIGGARPCHDCQSPGC
jgi:hypothetical protein